MKLIIQSGRVVATATDSYDGPESFVDAPADFDALRMTDYRLIDGDLVLQPGTRLTRLAFRNRFSQTEKVTLEMAGLDDPAASSPQRQQAAAIRVYLADVAASTFIDIGRADTRAGIMLLESAGLLAAGRALQILDTPVSPSEAFQG